MRTRRAASADGWLTMITREAQLGRLGQVGGSGAATCGRPRHGTPMLAVVDQP